MSLELTRHEEPLAYLAAIGMPAAVLDQNLLVVETNSVLIDLAGSRSKLAGRTLDQGLSALSTTERCDGRTYFRFDGRPDLRWLRLDIHLHALGALAVLVDVTTERQALIDFQSHAAAQQ
jgi:hypothetical protein